jgi:hypothetical protein
MYFTKMDLWFLSGEEWEVGYVIPSLSEHIPNSFSNIYNWKSYLRSLEYVLFYFFISNSP